MFKSDPQFSSPLMGSVKSSTHWIFKEQIELGLLAYIQQPVKQVQMKLETMALVRQRNKIKH